MEPQSKPEPRKSGRPMKTGEQLKTYSFSLSESQIARLDGWAKAKGESRSAVLRSLVMRLDTPPAPIVSPPVTVTAQVTDQPIDPSPPVESQADSTSKEAPKVDENPTNQGFSSHVSTAAQQSGTEKPIWATN